MSEINLISKVIECVSNVFFSQLYVYIYIYIYNTDIYIYV